MDPVTDKPVVPVPRHGKTGIANWIAPFRDEWDNVGVWKSAVKTTLDPVA